MPSKIRSKADRRRSLSAKVSAQATVIIHGCGPCRAAKVECQVSDLYKSCANCAASGSRCDASLDEDAYERLLSSINANLLREKKLRAELEDVERQIQRDKRKASAVLRREGQILDAFDKTEGTQSGYLDDTLVDDAIAVDLSEFDVTMWSDFFQNTLPMLQQFRTP